jgi:ketosteroid isomerase-like protein
MTESNVEVTRRLLDAWSRRDVEAAVELVHEDCEWHPALTAGGMEGAVYHGIEGMRRWFSELDEAWAELWIDVNEFREVGADRVLQLGQFHAVGKESGVPIDRPQAILMAFKDGLLIAAWGFPSHEAALEAAGLRE